MKSCSKPRVKLAFLELRVLMASAQFPAADTRLRDIAAPDSPSCYEDPEVDSLSSGRRSPSWLDGKDEGGVDLVHITRVAFEYQIPRFPVVRIMLRQIEFQAILPDRIIKTYSGLIQDHPSPDDHDVLVSI